jgi:hypothetical protein
MRMRGRWGFGLAVAVAVLAGCGATIVRSPKDGGPLYGKIVGNGETRMYVETTSGDRVGVYHADIESIDHPGNVAAVVGSVLTLYGLYSAGVGLRHCDDRGAAFCTRVIAPAAIGIPLFIGGLVTYVGSVSAAKQGTPKGFVARFFVSPATRGDGQVAQGASLGLAGTF